MPNVLITGCSTGIGFAIAEMMARNGYQVYATMRNPKNSPALEQIAQKDKLPITILAMDVDDGESVQKVVNEVVSLGGQVDILVNNAGIAPVGSVEEMPFETFAAVMQTNYFGTLRCIQAVLPAMRERRSGHIINITSVSGKIYSPCFGAYASSKAAVEALSESLAGEVGQFGIRVSLVEPGVIDTPLLDKFTPQAVPSKYPNHIRLVAYLKASASHHVMPDTVAEMVLTILADGHTAFRNPVGADGAPLLNYRASVSDEQWIAAGSLDEDAWAASMAKLGMDVRKFM
ncbi:SDR family oxidoreductase [Flavihumibacter fluvii]|uniref:SDR family oxidoreductase n=1 Tax=Flavihumibacter fluvii TaxID=2838157 RepID=UPI001BDE5978|nr:SDR family oxidoreductase [Flavihumibacter fluvii]ULQ51007.1 SDR family oxidoreductase [Flavihumibacter fluvii]